jgi:eukaryotic-like serine/threonine-protein kinase
MIGAGAPPAVPGLVLDRRVGRDAYGEVWRAIDIGAPGAVTVRIGTPAGGPGAAAREAALLRRVDHENVARLRSMLDLPDGRRAVVLDLVPDDDLTSLVARRGPLPTGEVVTVAVALARALEHVHGLGLVHGRLCAHDVRFAGDGRPVLAGVGIPSPLAPTTTSGPPTYPTRADDVRGLGEVLRYALVGDRRDVAVPGRLAPAVAACLEEDPDARPTPTRLATLAWDAGPAVPVDLGGGSRAQGAIEDETVRGSMRRGPLRVGIALAAAATAVTALAMAVQTRDDPASPGAGTAVGGLDDTRGVVSALVAARARALGTLSEPELGAVDAPGSAALAADRTFIGTLRRAGVRLSGLGFEVEDAHVLEVAGDTAVVQARVATSAHDQVGADGSLLRRVPPGSPRTVRLTLVRTPTGWRIAAAG